MLKEGTEIKMAVYTSGSNVRVVAEMDLISQDSGTQEPAIYLYETSVIRNPSTSISQADIDSYAKNVKSQFGTHRFSFKTIDKDQADLFIKHHTGKNWTVIREMSAL